MDFKDKILLPIHLCSFNSELTGLLWVESLISNDKSCCLSLQELLL
jgi:hypothetical protein